MKLLPLLLLASYTLLPLLGKADAALAGPVSASEHASRMAEYRGRAERELRDNILRFWLTHAVDRERGGFFGEITADLQVRRDAVRGSLLTSRILWTFSAAYRRFQDPAYREMARWAHRDLRERFWDPEFGGVYWSATADGKPVQQQKQVYAQVFALYALSEYHRATRDPEALDQAVALYRLLEKHARDPLHGGYFEVCTRAWGREEDPRRSALEPLGKKSQNTHLHVVEAYTSLYRVWPEPELKASQSALVEILLTRILDPRTSHLNLFFTADWKPTTESISFGHDIEAAWLLTEAAEVLGDAALLSRIRPLAVEIARVTLREGVDADGALFYEADSQGLTRREKEWWPQAEAAVGFLNAYQIAGDPQHLRAAYRVWDFIEERLVDRTHGEWFRAILPEGKPSDAPKVSLWKCPYHNGRACLEMMARLESLEQAARP